MTPLPILLYHSVDDEPRADFARWSVSVKQFEEHMAVVRRGGWTTVTMSTLVRLLGAGEELPERLIAVTFDDGFEDVLTRAVPVMDEMVGTAYVTSGYLRDIPDPQLDRPGRMLASSQLAAIADAGWEVGVHGHRHVALDAVGRLTAARDITESKHRVEDALGAPTTSFAYPYGYHDKYVQSLVRDAGFAHAVAVKNLYSHALDDPWGIARITIERGMDADWLDRRLHETSPRTAPPRERLITTGWRAARRVRTALQGVG
jgi:peptidoglycan/xylan/chitin deacetylase (PgdA/CDA1 family)